MHHRFEHGLSLTKWTEGLAEIELNISTTYMISATEGLSPANVVKCQSHLKEVEKVMEPSVPSWLHLE